MEGGVTYCVNENYFSYWDYEEHAALAKPIGQFAFGYDLSDVYGIRLAVNYSENAAANNARQTAGGSNYDDFFPYEFKSLNVFGDLFVSFNGLTPTPYGLSVKLYAGLGLGHSFGFEQTFDKYDAAKTTKDGVARRCRPHPYQYDLSNRSTQSPVIAISTYENHMHSSNYALGMRLGLAAEWDFHNNVGIFGDACIEAYSDWFNGLKPSSQDQQGFEGYAGFPYDLKPTLKFGLIYHFSK